MKREKWKSWYVNKKLFLNFLKIRHNNKKVVYTKSRESVIIPLFIDYIFNVYNGKSFVKFLVTKDMVGFKLGEFSPTRKTFFFKKQKKLYGTKD